MRYLSLLMSVIFTMLISIGCQNEAPQTKTTSKPSIKETPQKVVDQAKQETDKPMATVKDESEKVREHVKEESHKAMEHAQTMAHKMMEPAQEY